MALIDRLITVTADEAPPLRHGLIYKYCPPERIDILNGLKVRLTQPGAFNDPFEGYPYTVPRSDEELRAALDRNANLPEIWHVGLTRLHMDGLLDREVSLEEVQQDPIAAGKLLFGILDQQVEQELSRLDRTRVRMLWLFDLLLGIVSFSETNDDILMWGLYAQSHSGYVLGCDAAHEFYSGSLWPVRYTDERPGLRRDEVWNLRLHLTKATLWNHEKEWRFIAPRPMKVPSGTPMDQFGYPVILIDLPPSVIRCVVLGARVGDELRNQMRQVLASNPALSHVELLQATLDPHYFRVNVRPVS